MTFTYRIDKESRMVVLEGEQPSLEEWRHTLLGLFADPDFETGFNFLSDRRFSDEPRTADYLRAALTFLKIHADEIGQCKWATVVATKAAYGMGRMVQFLSEGMTIEIDVFTDIDEARHWLTGQKS